MTDSIIINGSYFSSKAITLDTPCEIHFTRFGDVPRRHHVSDVNIQFKDPSRFKVFICSNEPSSSVNRETNENIIRNSHKYDLILTSEKEILDSVSNSVFFPYGTTWLNKDKVNLDSLGVFNEKIYESVKNKVFGVSFISTSYLGKEGYNLRQHIWNTRQNIKIPSLFYSSTRSPTNNNIFSNTLHDGLLPNDDKINLFRTQFSIVIESSRENSYFTEKLIDCLVTKTIPIYFGCPNISEFFDVRGMIIVNSYQELINSVNSIDEQLYESMKPFIEENYIRAQKYASCFFERIQVEIQNYIDTMKSKKDILWIICILTIPEREEKLNRLLKLLEQYCPYLYKNRLLVTINHDNKVKSIGKKRQECLDSCTAKYISFVDDDDIISESYLRKLLLIMDTYDYDGIGFCGMFYYKNEPSLLFCHSAANLDSFRDNIKQNRPLNHLNPIKADIAKQIGFPDISDGEDSNFWERLAKSNLLKTHTYIEEIMYHYLYEDKK